MKLGRLNHIGVATPSIEESISYYRDVMGAGRIRDPFEMEEQGVKVCFVDTPGEKGTFGTQIELIGAELLAAGPDGSPRPVARASGWRLQTLDTAAVAQASVEPLRPLSQARGRDMKKDWERNYVHSLDWRWLTPPLNQGPGESWLRPEVDLVKGETMTALERLFAVADDANGIGAKLDIRRWTFLNTDLVVHIHRVPDGEWIGIRAETSYGPDGIGMTSGTLFDENGPVGAIQQSVLVRPRPPRKESAKTPSS